VQENTIIRITSVLVLFVTGLLLSACGAFDSNAETFEGVAWGPEAFESNGESIYFSGYTLGGNRIDYSGGPDMGMMTVGGNFSCASCHGPDARGGEHVMHMQVMDAPNIRWSALSAHEDEHTEEDGHADEEADHAADSSAYDLEMFRLAIVEGQHPDGEPLDDDMPRWDMTEQQLAELADYLQSLSE